MGGESTEGRAPQPLASEFFLSSPDAAGKRYPIYYLDRIAARTGIDYRLLDPDTGMPRAQPPMCDCGHPINEHKDNIRWSCLKCRCRGYGGDDV